MHTKKYDFIDFLRGTAILLVFINHIPRQEDILFSNFDYLQKLFFLIAHLGTYGVQLFYIVSAFTLLVSLNNEKKINYFNFFLRRIIRILPIFYLGIFFYSFYLNYGPTDLKNIFLNFLFLNNIIPPSKDLIPGGSTISTEMHFYLILPIMIVFINSYKKSLIAIFLILFFLLFLNLFFEYHFNSKYFGESNFYRTIFTQIFVFLLGFLAFHINKKFLNTKLNWTKIKQIIIGLMPVIPLSLLIFIIGRREIEFFYFRNLMIISIFLFLFFNFIYMIYKKLLNTLFFTIVKNIGQISFSMYVWHWAVINHLWDNFFLHLNNFPGKMMLFILISLIVTYAVSFITYQIEKYFINFGKKFSRKN
jgi:peptidoglycan/LPS O-acetylase OafA/YrhL